MEDRGARGVGGAHPSQPPKQFVPIPGQEKDWHMFKVQRQRSKNAKILFLEDFLQREPTSQYDPTGGNTQPEVTLDLGELVSHQCKVVSISIWSEKTFWKCVSNPAGQYKSHFSRTIPDLRIWGCPPRRSPSRATMFQSLKAAGGAAWIFVWYCHYL